MAEKQAIRSAAAGGDNPLKETVNSVNNNTALLGYTAGSASDAMDAGAALLIDFYTRVYPTVDELSLDLDELEDGELASIVAELRTEVEALQEETAMFEYNVTQIHSRGAKNAANANTSQQTNGGVDALLTSVSGGGAGKNAATAIATSAGSDVGSIAYLDGADGPAAASSFAAAARRGKGYRRKSQEDGDVFVGVTDKMAMLAKEGQRLQQQEERDSRQAAQVKDLLTATVEESQRRLKELRLEFRQFLREVFKTDKPNETSAVADATTTATATNTAYADDLLTYMRHRVQSQNGYLDKLHVQCAAAEQDIGRAQQQLRQRKAAGEAFNAVDFAQLRIENEQSNERIDKKNAELAELKNTSTRAVQTLNSLMDALTELNTEQTQLKKELKSRGEYLSRCAKEVDVVAAEAVSAEKKNQTVKAQHEAVKVPKIEEYIAQTAELFELQKALKNWSRKVDIAEGQVKVLRQQTRKLREQRDAAVAYAEAKKRKRQAATLPSMARRATGLSSGGAGAAAATATRPAASSQRESDAHGVTVGGTKSLLQAKRQGSNSNAEKATPTGISPSAATRETVREGKKPKQTASNNNSNTAAAASHEGGGGKEDSAVEGEETAGTRPQQAPPPVSVSVPPHPDGSEDVGEEAEHNDRHLRAVAPTIAPESPTRAKSPPSPSSTASSHAHDGGAVEE